MCLHCLVWDLINKHSPVWPDQPDKAMYDLEYIVGNLTGVMAEPIAGIPERRQRRDVIKQVNDLLLEKIREAMASGDHAQYKMVARQ